MKVTHYGTIESYWDLCGPGLSAYGPEDELSGPRCPRCRKIIDETGENTYCGRYTRVAWYRTEPEWYEE